LQTWEILKDVKVPLHVQSSFCHDASHPQVLEETGRPLIDLLDSQVSERAREVLMRRGEEAATHSRRL
jgi:hypothetical protein